MRGPPQDERGLDRERKRDRLRRLWLLAVSSPAYIVMTVTVLAFAGPALMAAFGATIGLLTFVALLLQIFLITLAPGVCVRIFLSCMHECRMQECRMQCKRVLCLRVCARVYAFVCACVFVCVCVFFCVHVHRDDCVGCTEAAGG